MSDDKIIDALEKTVLQVDGATLQAMFKEVKNDDFTRSQFEQEKTKRISALCAAASALASATEKSNYGNSPRDEILMQLKKVVDSYYGGI